jgi:hypothetical protein
MKIVRGANKDEGCVKIKLDSTHYQLDQGLINQPGGLSPSPLLQEKTCDSYR